MGRKNFIVLSLLVITTLHIAAQSNFEFVENKGQWDSKIKFKGELSTGAFFLQKQGFTVLLHHPTDLTRVRGGDHTTGEEKNKGGRFESKVVKPLDNPGIQAGTLRSHSYQVEFLGANENAEIVPDRELPFYTNYFIGNDPAKWTSHARVFQALLYKDIYPNIDVRYYSENGRLKYDLIVRAGGDVNKIAMRYRGVDKLSIKNNELIVKTSVGDVKELYPYSFQFDNMKGKKKWNVIINWPVIIR